MRVASRIVGVVLALAGLVFLGLSIALLIWFRPESVLEGPGWGKRATGGFFGVALSVGFILAGWYFLRLDVDKLDDVDDRPASRFAPYFLAHRRELTVIAQAGLAISLIRLVAVGFGHGWSVWPLVLAWFCLVIIGRQIAKPGTMDLDWQTVPERMRPAFKGVVKAIRAAFLILMLIFAWNQWSHRVPRSWSKPG